MSVCYFLSLYPLDTLQDSESYLLLTYSYPHFSEKYRIFASVFFSLISGENILV